MTVFAIGMRSPAVQRDQRPVLTPNRRSTRKFIKSKAELQRRSNPGAAKRRSLERAAPSRGSSALQPLTRAWPSLGEHSWATCNLQVMGRGDQLRFFNDGSRRVFSLALPLACAFSSAPPAHLYAANWRGSSACMSSSCRKASRARDSRERTVPIGTFRIWAVSS